MYIRMGGLNKSVCITPIDLVVWSTLLNHTKNRTPGHMVSNSGLYLYTACAVHVTIFSLVVSSDQFQILQSYMLLL